MRLVICRHNSRPDRFWKTCNGSGASTQVLSVFAYPSLNLKHPMHFITHERQYLTASTLRQASTSKVHEEMLLELQLHAAGYRRKLALP